MPKTDYSRHSVGDIDTDMFICKFMPNNENIQYATGDLQPEPKRNGFPVTVVCGIKAKIVQNIF